jgi:quercetin dioxygenase-like cupin family protein
LIMAVPHAASGEVLDVRPLGEKLSGAQTTTLVKGAAIEVIRLVVPAGKEIAEHRAPGDITIQCLEGKVMLQTAGGERELTAGSLVYLAGAEPHAVRAVADASLLLTIVLKPKSGA